MDIKATGEKVAASRRGRGPVVAVTVVMLISRLGCDFGEGFLSSSVSQQGRKEHGQSCGRGGASPYCPQREAADRGLGHAEEISKCPGTYGQIILLILLSLSQKENLC